MPKTIDDTLETSSIEKTPLEGKVTKKKGRDSSIASLPKEKKQKIVSVDGEKAKRKKHRFKPGTVANREVRKYQHGAKATDFLIPSAPVYRWIKEIMSEVGDYRIEKDAITVLRVALEDEGIKVMSTANRMAQHASRKTIMPCDLDAARDVRVLHPGRVEARINKADMAIFPVNLPNQYRPLLKASPKHEEEPQESSRVTEVHSNDPDADASSSLSS